MEIHVNQNDLGKKNTVEGLTLSDSETYYNATVIKTVWYWNKERYID